ncbi:MAG: hypothetical protein KGI51_14530 [Rhodospirillales bacterium]|nr:hypothetical protein [Rhodospirillales bacterium]
MSEAYFLVRAALADPAERDRFEHWYETEHMPDAIAAFGAAGGWRCWSRTEPAVHFAFYSFPDAEAALAAAASPRLPALIAEFDRVWGGRVTRTREVLECAGTRRPA